MDPQLPPPVFRTNPPIPSLSPSALPTQPPSGIQSPGNTSPPRGATTSFSATDAARVILRGISTVSECLLFAGRKVTLCLVTCSGWLIGATKGTLRYAHENLDNRIVQQVQNQTAPRVPQSPARGNPPWEEYVMNDAKEYADLLSGSVQVRHGQYHWLNGESIGALAFACLVPYTLFGPVGAVIFNLPRLCGAIPYITFDRSTDHSQPLPFTPESSRAGSASQTPHQSPSGRSPQTVVSSQQTSQCQQPPSGATGTGHHRTHTTDNFFSDSYAQMPYHALRPNMPASVPVGKTDHGSKETGQKK